MTYATSGSHHDQDNGGASGRGRLYVERPLFCLQQSKVWEREYSHFDRRQGSQLQSEPFGRSREKDTSFQSPSMDALKDRQRKSYTLIEPPASRAPIPL